MYRISMIFALIVTALAVSGCASSRNLADGTREDCTNALIFNDCQRRLDRAAAGARVFQQGTQNENERVRQFATERVCGKNDELAERVKSRERWAARAGRAPSVPCTK